MKRIIIMIVSFVILLITPVIVLADNSVGIKLIELDSKSENAYVISDPTYEGFNINFDVGFKKLNDYVKYKVVVKNDTDVDYKISEDTSFNVSEYVSYSYEVGGELKAKSESTIYVTITYSKELEHTQLTSNGYSETNRAVVKLLDEDNKVIEEVKEETKEEVKNPNTSRSLSVLLILAIITALVMFIIMVANRKYITKYMVIIFMMSILSIPFIVKALEELKFSVNVNVEIKRGYEVGYYYEDSILFLEEEKDNYRRTQLTMCDVVYIGTNKEKYNYCNDMIIADEVLYAGSEVVNLKRITTKYINDIDACQLQEDGSFYCEDRTNVVEITTDRWNYERMLLERCGYTSLDTDKEDMSFANISFDVWDSSGYFTIIAPQTFKMPSHDILFLAASNDR